MGNFKDAITLFSRNLIPLQYTGTYLQYYGKTLNSDKRYAQGIEILECASHLTSDDILYTTLGDSYKSLKRYSEAENAYQYASFMAPHKLYPNYLLANLYTETGQKEMALKTANQVLDKSIKVESTATEEIKHKMQELILRLNNQ
jgi:tetratricopeptide (TPR) repeat protein